MWVLAALLAWAGMAWAGAAERSVVGLWWTQDHEGVISIAPCDGSRVESAATVMCGSIVGQAVPVLPDGSVPRNIHGVPHCGLRILHDARPEPDDVWRGRITDPTDGTDWQCEFHVEGGVLRLRGYVLVTLLGQTQTWTAFHGTATADCHLS